MGEGYAAVARGILERMRAAVAAGVYDLTAHALHEMGDDDLQIWDLEAAILTGRLRGRQRGDPRGRWSTGGPPIGQAESARSDVVAAESELQAATADLQRFEQLLRANAGSRKQRDDAETRRNTARDRMAAAESRVRSAEEALRRLRTGARREEIEVARARVAAASAQAAALDKNLADTTFASPVSGIVTQQLVEVGEVIAPRTPALVVVDLVRAWADVFVPEPAVPRIRIGQSATVHTDAGGPGLDGTVTYISPKAEFTPRNVQTVEDRSKLVYRIRVSVDNTDGVLKQGMPVEAVVPYQQ